MEGYENTKELFIQLEDSRSVEQRYVEYPLYQESYEIAIKDIFHRAFSQEEDSKKNKNRVFKNEKRNILTFIGKRGSGKTTAMDELCRILKRMKDQDYRDWWVSRVLDEESKKKLGNRSFSFHVMKPIDAALLEEKENLFEIILAAIYQHFLKDAKIKTDVEYRKIGELFHEIFRMYDCLSGKITPGYGMGDIITRIGVVGSSYDIQQKIANLVDMVLDNYGDERENEYIVIAIDDLDLNMRHGYEMLEQMLKYFAYHKILILLTLDYTLMEEVCLTHFKNELYSDNEELKNGRPEMMTSLTHDYITKIFHWSQRMYMPTTQQVNDVMQIVTREDGQEKLFFVEEFILNKIARTMNIQYDILDVEQYLFQPSNVRELVTYNEFLESFVKIDFSKLCKIKGNKTSEEMKSGNIKWLQLYDENHNRFNYDILFRIASEKLDVDQRACFEKLTEKKIDYRSAYFISLYRNRHDLLVQQTGNRGYCYGELLEHISDMWSENGNRDEWLARCFLAYMTSEMVREYMHYLYNPDERRRQDKYRMRLLRFLGESFSNPWVGQMLPEVRREINREYQVMSMGYVDYVNREMLHMMFSASDLEKVKGGTKKQKKSIVKKWICENRIIELFEITDMFLISKDDTDEYCEYGFELWETEDEDLVDRKKLLVLPYGGRVTFDIIHLRRSVFRN